MMNPTPLNPDAPDSQVSEYQRVEVIETPARDYPSHGSVTIRLYHSERQSTAIQIAERTAERLRDQLNGYLAVAQPEVNTVEELAELPGGSIIFDASNSAYEMCQIGWPSLFALGTELDLAIDNVVYPARVLYRPEVES